MNLWLNKFEKPIIKIAAVVMLGFGVGFLLNHDWNNGIESISIGILMLIIYRLGMKFDALSKDDE